MVRQMCFHATDATQLGGSNQGYVYSPNTLHHTGPSFEIKAGESLVIVPYQPAGKGPWNVFQSALVDSDLKIFTKNPRVFCIKINNKWMTKSIRVNRFCSLDDLLCNQGIEHILSSLSYDDLTEMTDDEEDEDNDKVVNKSCACPCCLKLR
jgi:hypothetical protein